MKNNTKNSLVIMAGEPSGDALGARLMEALLLRDPSLEFHGIGGSLMNKAGLNAFFSIDDLSTGGVEQTLKKSRFFMQKLTEVSLLIKEVNPIGVVTIDFSGFHYKLGKRLRKIMPTLPLIHYVAPSVWAWRSWRAKSFSGIFNKILALFPFEPPLFPPNKTVFVGHPLVENSPGNPLSFCHNLKKSSKRLLITVLPGSRQKELDTLLPIFKQTLEKMHTIFPELEVVIPCVEETLIKVKQQTALWNFPIHIVLDPKEKQDAYAASVCALAASGTACLELAHAGVPTLMTYKVASLTRFLIKSLVKVRFFCLVNILLNKEIIPECVQEKCEPSYLAKKLIDLMTQSSLRDRQKQAFMAITPLLTPANGMAPSHKAADEVLETIAETV